MVEQENNHGLLSQPASLDVAALINVLSQICDLNRDTILFDDRGFVDLGDITWYDESTGQDYGIADLFSIMEKKYQSEWDSLLSMKCF